MILYKASVILDGTETFAPIFYELFERLTINDYYLVNHFSTCFNIKLFLLSV